MNAFETQKEYDDFVNMLIAKHIIQKDWIDIEKLITLGYSDQRYNFKLIAQHISFLVTLLNNGIDVLTYLNTKVPNNMFYSPNGTATHLPDIILPDRIEIISQNAFAGCYMNNFVFSSSLKRIENDAFWGSSLQTVDLSRTQCKVIGSPAFLGCFKLKEVILPETIEQLYNHVFSGSYGSLLPLNSINFPSSLRSIGIGCFESCSFTKLEFNEGLETIEANAFDNNTALTEVILPTTLGTKTLIRIADCNSDQYIFKNCSNLKTIYCKSKSQYEYIKFHQTHRKQYEGVKVPDIVLIK